jgi:hypothetical protein
VIDLYDYVDPDGGTFSIIPGATPGLSGHTFDPSLAGVGTYTIRWTHNHVGPGHIDQSVTVVSAAVAPTTIASFPDKFCEDQGGNIDLSVSDGSGTTLRWYNDFCGGTEIGSGNPLTIAAPTTTTTYFALWENACGQSLCDNYAVVVYPLSASDMAINGLDSPYCSDALDDNLSGDPAFGYLTKTFSFTGPAAGFTDNGDGTAVISPSNLPNGAYNITYEINKDNCTHSITEPVTILPPLVVSFVGLNSPVCIDWGNQNLTGSEAPGGTFSGPGITDNGNGTAIFNPGVAGGGTHTIVYTYTDGNNCTATDSQTVTVNALPALFFQTLENDYCVGDGVVVLTGSEAPDGTYTINGVPGPLAYFIDNGDGTADFDPTTAGAGIYQIRYHYTDVNTCNNQASLTTEVHAILVPTISGDANPCQNDPTTYTTEAGMDNYNWSVSAGGSVVGGGTATDNTITINWDNDGAQTVSISYDDPNGGCTSTTVTQNVTVKPAPTVTLDPFLAVCLNDAPFALSGGNGLPAGGSGVYSGPGVAAGIFDPSVAGGGTHTITYTYTAANTCSASDSETIDVVNINASVSNLDASYCTLAGDETLIGVNTDGGIGTFSIAPLPTNGAMFTDNGDNTATFSPNNCDAADYNVAFTVTYSYTNGSCSASDQTSTFVYGQPTVNINGLLGTYCTDDAIDAFTGTPPNGSFSTTAPAGLTDDGAGNGTFDPGAAGAAGSPYTISYYYSDPAGCDNTIVQNINVNQSPDPVLNSSDADNTICDGASVTFTATDLEGVADTWEFLVDGSTAQAASASNTFTSSSLSDGEEVTVIASVGASSCSATSAGITTTVIAAPNPSFISGDVSVCEGDVGMIYETQAGMNNYTWAVIGGVITAGGTATDHTATVTWNTPGAQSISVNYENANACSAASATVLGVTVSALPNPNLAVSDDEICEGDMALITLSGSQLGVTYQLRYDVNDAPVGAALNGTGGDLNFADNPLSTTTYNIIASNSNGCVNELLDKPIITVNPLPIAGISCSDADLSICQGTNVSFTASGGDTYEFFVEGVSVQGPSALNVYTTNGINDGDAVSVEVSWAATSCYEISADIIMTVLPLPSISLTGDQEVCFNETGVVYTTDAGMSNYSWSVVGGTVDAGGGVNDPTVTVSWTSLGAQSVSVNYENANACQAAVDQSLAVNVNDLPDGSFNLSDPIICAGDLANIEQDDSELGVSYQLRLNSDDSPVGSAVNGTGSAIQFNVSPIATTSYNVLATSAASCTTELTDVSVVTVNALPNNALTILGSTICLGDAGAIVLQASELGVSYQLRKDSDDSPIGVPLVGTGGDLTFNVAPVTTTTYNILATNGNSCSEEMATLPIVTVNPLPDASLTVSDDEICTGETASIILYNSVPGIDYQLRLNSDNSLVGASQTGDGSDLLFNASPLTTTTYNIIATDGNACSSELTDLAVVQVNPLPSNTLNITSPDMCIGESAIITLESSVPGVTYQLRLDSDNSNVGAAVPGNGSDINFSVSPLSTTVYNVLATSADGCTVELVNKSTVTVFPAPADNLLVDDDEICLGETASIVLYNSEVGVNYQLRLDSDNSNIGAAIAGTGGDITFNVNPTSTSIYNVYAYNTNACATELLDKPTVTVNPLPDHTLSTSDDEICAGETADIVLYNSVLGVNYQLRLDSDDSNIGSSQAGNGGSLTFHDAPLATTVYNIIAIDANGCSSELTDKPLVEVYPMANDNLTVSDPTICYGENAIISVSNSQNGVSYQLRLDSDNSNVGAAVPGNDGTITFNVSVLNTTLFNVLATTSNSCSVELTDRSLVTVIPSPVKNPVELAAGVGSPKIVISGSLTQ